MADVSGALGQVQFSTTIGWTLNKVVSGFVSIAQGPDNQSFALSQLDLSNYGQLSATNYTILSGQTQSINLYSYTDLAGNVTGMQGSGVVSVFVLSNSGTVQYSASSGLALNFGLNSSGNVLMPPGAMFAYSLPGLSGVGAGQTVTSGAGSVFLNNVSGNTAFGYLFAVGG